MAIRINKVSGKRWERLSRECESGKVAVDRIRHEDTNYKEECRGLGKFAYEWYCLRDEMLTEIAVMADEARRRTIRDAAIVLIEEHYDDWAKADAQGYPPRAMSRRQALS